MIIILFMNFIPKNKSEYYKYLTVINPDYYNMSIYSYISYEWPAYEGSYTIFIIIGVVLGFIIFAIIIRLICKAITSIRVKKLISSNPLCENTDP